MKYPEWAPDVLCDLHVKVLEQCEQLDRSGSQLAPMHEQFVSILEKMITQSDMEAVWQSLHRHGARDDDLGHFFHAAYVGSEGPTAWEKMTRARQRKHVENLTTAAHRLADLLEPTPFDRAPYRFLAKQDAHHLLTLLQPGVHPAKGYREEDDADWLEALLSWSWPKMSGLLHVLVLKVHTMAQEIASERPILLNPNIENARRVYFIRHLSRHLHRRYNTPLHSVVAATAQTVLGDEINEDTVRAVVRNHTP